MRTRLLFRMTWATAAVVAATAAGPTVRYVVDGVSAWLPQWQPRLLASFLSASNGSWKLMIEAPLAKNP